MSPRKASEHRSIVSDNDVDAVMRASRALMGIAAASIAEVDDLVTVAQLRILTMIYTRGPLNVTAVAKALDVSPSNASRACDRLMKAGLIDRRESPEDRRNVTLLLTETGRELVDRVTGHRRAAIEQVLRKITLHDRDRLVAVFDDFATASGEPPGDDHLSHI